MRELRQERELERLREENLRFKMKSEEGSRRMLSAMLGGQDSLRLKEVFAVWRDSLRELRQERELEMLRESHQESLARREESSKRMLVMLMGSQSSLMLKETSWEAAGEAVRASGEAFLLIAAITVIMIIIMVSIMVMCSFSSQSSS